MIKSHLLHPDILNALASNGHGAKVLIADGNFPILTGTPASCKRIFLNLAPDILTVPEVLKVIKDAIVIETAVVMLPENGVKGSVHQEFDRILDGMNIQGKKRHDFYDEVNTKETCLAILTGETRRYANILIEIGSLQAHSNFS